MATRKERKFDQGSLEIENSLERGVGLFDWSFMPEKIIIGAINKQKVKKTRKYFHSSLASGRWFTFPIAQQLGNIGSEVGRALNWKEKNMPQQAGPALARALELFDLTLADGRWKGHRWREIARAREVVCDFLAGDNHYKSEAVGIRKYFDTYAFASRRLINK